MKSSSTVSVLRCQSMTVHRRYSYRTHIIQRQLLYARHIAQELEQHPVQIGTVIFRALDQFQQSPKHALLLHHLKGILFGATIEQQECCHDLEVCGIFFLGIRLVGEDLERRTHDRTCRRP